MKKGLTYSDAGVDVAKIRSAQKSIGDILSSTYTMMSEGRVLSGFGHYAGLVRLGSQTLALHSDGVGTKVIVAQEMNKFDTVGIDCVAMNVNDIICVGAKPVSFIDYIALKHPNEKMVEEIARGLVEGARQAQVSIVGGETAVLPELIAGTENSFDLAGMVMGVVQNNKPLLGNAIKHTDIILGVESSGLHSNGYTLARKVLLSKYSVEDTAEHIIQTVGEELLIPTRIYVRPVIEILKKNIPVHGLAHITGGSFTKLPRIKQGVQYYLDNLPSAKGIFRQIQIDGSIETREMYRTFNMGVGFCLVAPKTSVEEVIRVFKKHKMECRVIGRIMKGSGVVAKVDGRAQVL